MLPVSQKGSTWEWAHEVEAPQEPNLAVYWLYARKVGVEVWEYSKDIKGGENRESLSSTPIGDTIAWAALAITKEQVNSLYQVL